MKQNTEQQVSKKGYAISAELDTDDHGIHYYDNNGMETSQVPYSQDDGDQAKLYAALTTDPLFVQFIV